MEYQNELKEANVEANSPILNNPHPYNENNTWQNKTFLYPIIDSLTGWMKFMGIYTIIIGAITCVGIITAAIGVPIIFAGISLINASKNVNIYKSSNSPYILNETFNYLNKYFKIQSILVIIGFVLSIIYIAILLFFSLTAVNNYFQIY